MTVIPIGFLVADLGLARVWPCSAVVGPQRMCGATPASLYRRECGVTSHTDAIWLCPVHAAMAACGMTICRECAGRNGIRTVRLVRLSEPLRGVA
jgi:hypothetical protein